MSKTLKEVLIDGSTFYVSFSKLVGQEIKEITGYITKEFGDATFKLSKIVMADGTSYYVEGEHDMPYLTEGTAKFDGPELEALYKEGNP